MSVTIEGDDGHHREVVGFVVRVDDHDEGLEDGPP